MPKICYQHRSFQPDSLAVVGQCDAIIGEYVTQGYKLTLRQLYYVLVARDLFPDERKWRRVPGTADKWVRDPAGTKNATPNYKWLGGLVNDGRLAGLLDWDAIEDRTRNLKTISHWDSPSDIMDSAASSFRVDKWGDQECRVEVWIEKEALEGVFDRICKSLDVPLFACRGYTSQSEMWGAAMRFLKYISDDDKDVHVFHFGDHDPSGIDMTRDIQERLRMFIAYHLGSEEAERLTITRVALNIDQVRKYNPPENPAKATDSRFEDYVSKFGDSSWELDALTPPVLAGMVKRNVRSVRDEALWEAQVERENRDRATLSVISGHWAEVESHSSKKWGREIGRRAKEG